MTAHTYRHRFAKARGTGVNGYLSPRLLTKHMMTLNRFTGLSSLAPELSGKQLELLKESVPKLSRVAVVGSSAEPANAQTLKETEFAARALGVKLQNLDIRDSEDIGRAFRAASRERADAVLALSSPFTFAQRKRVVELAAKNRLPAMYWATEFVEAGGL
jgi:putative tryptophan/tyrosine transport system substrate-binding protein